MATTKLLLSIEEAAGVLDLGRSKLYELIAAGELATVTIGRSRKVPLAAVEEYVERLRAAAGEPDIVPALEPGAVTIESDEDEAGTRSGYVTRPRAVNPAPSPSRATRMKPALGRGT